MGTPLPFAHLKQDQASGMCPLQTCLGSNCYLECLLLLKILDQLLCFVVLLFQGLILALSLFEMLIHSVAQRLGLDPVGFQLQHSLLILFNILLKLVLF